MYSKARSTDENEKIFEEEKVHAFHEWRHREEQKLEGKGKCIAEM